MYFRNNSHTTMKGFVIYSNIFINMHIHSKYASVLLEITTVSEIRIEIYKKSVSVY